VTLLGCRGRHALFDDAETFGTMKMPTVAGLLTDRIWIRKTGPGVVFGVATGNDSHAGGLLPSNKRETIAYTRHRFSVQVRSIANEDDFTIFVV
jgi:hypothetical protein